MPRPRSPLCDALALCGALALAPACGEDEAPAPRGPGGFQRAPTIHTDAGAPDDAGAGVTADVVAQTQSVETMVSPTYVYARVTLPPGVGQMAPVNRQ